MLLLFGSILGVRKNLLGHEIDDIKVSYSLVRASLQNDISGGSCAVFAVCSADSGALIVEGLCTNGVMISGNS